PVVDAQEHALEMQDLAPHRDEQRERQESMRDGGAEGTRRRALGVDMNPLMVIGGVGKCIDLLLRDLAPLAVPDVFAGQCCQLGDARDGCGHGVSSVPDSQSRVRMTTGISRSVRCWY